MTWLLVDPEAKPDEMAERVNWRELQRHVTPRGFRAPMGNRDQPSYGFSNDSMAGAGLYANGDGEVGLVANAFLQRPSAVSRGAVLEISPNGTPDVDDPPAQVVISEIDTADDNDTKTQLVIEADGSTYTFKTVAEIGGELRDFVWGVEENGTFIESMRLTKEGDLGVGVDEPEQRLHVDGLVMTDADFIMKAGSEFEGNMTAEMLTDHRFWTFPDKDGTVAMLDDITAGTGVEIKDEGVSQGSATTVDFVGAGVTASVAAGTATITIAGGSTHDMLSATHTDSTAAAVSRGSLIAGIGATPKWEELVVGSASTALITDGTDVAWGKVPLATHISGTLPIANGGTGQTAQTAAMDALSPTTTKGDLLVDNGTNVVRLAVGATNGHVLTVDSAETTGLKYAAQSGGSTNILLDGSNHTDTANRAAVRGALIVADSGPLWTRLDLGTAGFVLRSDGTDALWARNYGTVVYVPTTADTAINSVTDITIVTRDVTGVAAGDQLVVEGEFVILNNSGATRVYVITVDFDGLFDIEISTGALATSATLMHPFTFRAILDVRSTSLSYEVVSIDGQLAAGIAGGTDTTMAATHLSGKGWNTSTTDITGTTTVTLTIRSANATATQTCRLHCFSIRKFTPT